jgi:hypothetical protein
MNGNDNVRRRMESFPNSTNANSQGRIRHEEQIVLVEETKEVVRSFG